jgi:hypothetical protein
MSEDDLIAEAISYWCEEETDARRRKVRVQYDALRAEPDRLLAEVATCRELRGYDRKDINELKLELDRLREALESIAATGPMLTAEEASDMARAALAKEAD